jgi:hypothetical protein
MRLVHFRQRYGPVPFYEESPVFWAALFDDYEQGLQRCSQILSENFSISKVHIWFYFKVIDQPKHQIFWKSIALEKKIPFVLCICITVPAKVVSSSR